MHDNQHGGGLKTPVVTLLSRVNAPLGLIPGAVSAMRAARQQRGELDFSWINRLHVPVALLSTVLMLAVLARFWRSPSDDVALLAASATVAVLANAFVCGALSGPHDRYGARIAWVSNSGRPGRPALKNLSRPKVEWGLICSPAH